MTDTFLRRAAEITTGEARKLRSLLAAIAARAAPAQADLRQLARTLDELTVRKEAAGGGGVLLRQVEQLRQRHAQLSAEVQSLQRAERAIEQLARQVEMNSALLESDDTSAADPWRAALMAQVIQGREEERVRLAREVHDGPAQVIAHVVMGLEHSLTLAQQPSRDRLEAHVRELRDTSRAGLHEVRRFIADLRPPALDEHGLGAALDELAERFNNAGTLHVRVEQAALPRLAAEQELVIYRIAQEALVNAAKHARGAPVLLQCGVQDDAVVLRVRDDGRGFDPRTVLARTKGAHWGLRSMRERAELIGARLQIFSAVGKGTTVELRLPIVGSTEHSSTG